MTHIGVERFAAGQGQKDGAEHRQAGGDPDQSRRQTMRVVRSPQ